MKRHFGLILSLVVTFSAFPAYAGPDPQALDRHELQLELLPDRQRLIGQDTIRFGGAAASPLEFQLADGMTVEGVDIGGEPVPYLHSGTMLQVTPPVRAVPAHEISIRFSGRFDDRPSTAPAQHETPGYGVTATILPQGTFLSSGLAWYPRRSGEHRIDIRVSAPAGYHAVTTGRRAAFHPEGSRADSEWAVETPVSGLALAAGPFQVHELTAGKIPIYAYFYPSSAALAEEYLQAAAGYLALYEELFGPYPYHKFAIVENFFPTGYGFPSWTLLGSSVIRLPFIVKTSLGHEIAHSWWGTGVRVDEREGNWSEGLTTYVADYLFQELSSAAQAREYRLKILRDYAVLRNEHEFPVTEFRARYDKQSQAIGYGKAAMLFHMIRKRIGDAAFWKALRAVAAGSMYREVSWSDLLRQFSDTSGEPVADLFTPWLKRTGAPELSLAAVAVEKTADGWEVTGTLRQQPPFPLRVPLRVTTDAGDLGLDLEADDAVTRFSIAAAGRPVALAVDPGADLFRLLSPAEIPASVNNLRGAENLVVVPLPGQEQYLGALQILLAGLRHPQPTFATLKEFRNGAFHDADLLFLGAPDNSDLPPAADGQQPRLIPSRAGNAMLTLLKRSDDPQRVIAVYQPGAAEFAESVAQKIPHYGEYSQLEFSAGKLIDKRILETGVNPLAVAFEQPEAGEHE